MDEYKSSYLRLFNRISDIIKELQLAQQEAEEIYVAMAKKAEPLPPFIQQPEHGAEKTV